jgi:hypothetical protein
MNITAAFKNQAGFGRRWIIIVAVIVVAVPAIFFVFQVQKKETIKIGAIMPISVPAAHHADVLDAMLLAAEEVNS